jgi:Flp pilus assembly pilin Flp
MRRGFLHIVFRLQRLIAREDGQDLVEYALIIALLVMTTTAATKPLAVVIGNAFNGIFSAFNNAIG